jgi:hypothetical protein
MAINSTLDVVIQEDDLVVLGPPSTVDIAVDFGPKGDRGSTFFTGSGDPNDLSLTQFEIIHGAVPVYGDVYLRIDFGADYGTFYTYNAVPGGDQWSAVLDLLQTMELFFQFNDQAADSFYTAVGASAIYGSASAVPQIRFDGQKRINEIVNIPITIVSSQISDYGSALANFLSDAITSNTEAGLNVTYDAENDKINFDVDDFVITLTGDVLGQGTVTDLSNVSISASVQDNSHNHISANISDFTESVQDVIGEMVVDNAEAGLSVTYDDASGKLNFDVNDFDIVLYGDVQGIATVTDLGDVVMNTTVLNDSHFHSATTIQGIEETIEDVVGAMVESNIENGIQVTYFDGGANTRGKLNFDVGDFTITYTGDVSGSSTITNLASTTTNIQVLDDSHNHSISTINDFTEQAQDAAAVLFDHPFHTNISVNYDDANNRIFLVASGTFDGGGGGGETGAGNLAYTWWFGV